MMNPIEQAAIDPVFWAEMTLPEAPGDGSDPSKPLVLKYWQRAAMRAAMNNPRVTVRVRRQCGKSIVLIVTALWYCMWTRKEIMIVCPQESQVVNFYDKMLYFIENTEILKKLVGYSKQSPFRQIEFKTGAKVKFMIAGNTGSGVRGQSADILILDECDELTDAAYKAILPVVNKPDKKVMAGTTINGRRSYFYYWVHDKTNSWTNIWVNPEEDPDYISYDRAKRDGIPIEKSHEYYYRHELRLNDLAYMHEVKCEWADAALGVYRRKDVEAAYKKCSYSYDDYADYVDPVDFPSSGPVFIGVDWDKFQGVGPQICAVQLQPANSEHYGKLRVIWREEIPPHEYCLGAAVKRIIELNEHFNAVKIYIDPGMGERQIEELRLYGTTNPESGLKDKIVRFSFKAKDIEFVDPTTGKIDKKENKHWMVGTSQMYFQEGRIILCPEDDLLYNHLMDYMADVTAHGSVTYSDKNEHTIDALNLAIIGFDREMGETYASIVEADVFISIGSLPKANIFERDDGFSDYVISESEQFVESNLWQRRQSSQPIGRGTSGAPHRRPLSGFRRSL